MEDKKEDKLVFSLKPKFNFIYELFLPTGAKLSRNVVMIIVDIFILIAINVMNNIESFDMGQIVNTLSNVFIIALIVLIIILIIQIILQIIQYKKISYDFYNDYLEYNDTFLNKHSKKIMYANIKEIEIQRTVFDRIMGYGKIIIFTNAEKLASSALIIFALKDSEEVYNKIDKLVHRK